jgi:hypothetical protein
MKTACLRLLQSSRLLRKKGTHLFNDHRRFPIGQGTGVKGDIPRFAK